MSNLATVRRLARRKFDQLIDSNHCHAGCLAEQALLWAAQKAGFDHCGIEGWCDHCGARGITYLNTGDAYIPTVYAVTSRYSARFYVGDQESMLRHKVGGGQ